MPTRIELAKDQVMAFLDLRIKQLQRAANVEKIETVKKLYQDEAAALSRAATTISEIK